MKRSDRAHRLFAGVRRRLILWYAGVIAAVLLIVGIVLYSGTRQIDAARTNGMLQRAAQGMSRAWQDFAVAPCLPLGDTPLLPHDVPYLACYAADGSLVAVDGSAQAITAFTTTTLARTALTHGTATDVIDGGNGLGAIQRYALVVRDPKTNVVLGVVQVGTSIAGEERSEAVLLTLLIALGVAMIAVVVGSGFWLASLALAPARLAFAHQQRFIADASHELRTPLTLLRADAELLARTRERLAPEDATLVDDIVAEASHLSDLATHLLTLARLDAAALRAETEIIDLGALVGQIVPRVRAFAAQHTVTVTVTSDAPTPVLALGDPLLLTEALLTLVNNAITYNRPAGEVRITVAASGHQASIAVCDTGPGIAPKDLARLGERFFRVDAARNRAQGGTGLGLAIAQGLVAAQHSTLHFASIPDAGTTATITLPRATP
jgi:signal transduction histidine kinase